MKLDVLLFSPSWQQKKEQGAIDSADKEILAEAERLEVRAMGPLILSELLFDENIREQIKKYKRHFLRVSPSVAVSFVSNWTRLLQAGDGDVNVFRNLHCFLFIISFATMIKRLRSTSWVVLSVWWSSIRVSCCLVSPSFSKTCMTRTCWKKTSYSHGPRR